jgi:hypothetical protein
MNNIMWNNDSKVIVKPMKKNPLSIAGWGSVVGVHKRPKNTLIGWPSTSNFVGNQGFYMVSKDTVF